MTEASLTWQGVPERLVVLYPQDVLLLSVDHNRISITYEVTRDPAEIGRAHV